MRLTAAAVARGQPSRKLAPRAAAHHGATFGPPCSASARRSRTAAAASLMACSAARSPASASANRCTSSATRRARESMIRHRPEQQRAFGRVALNTWPQTRHSRFVAVDGVGVQGGAPPLGGGSVAGRPDGTVVTGVCDAGTGHMIVIRASGAGLLKAYSARPHFFRHAPAETVYAAGCACWQFQPRANRQVRPFLCVFAVFAHAAQPRVASPEEPA